MRVERAIRISAVAFCALAAILAALALTGWSTGELRLASLVAGSIPMAPSTAVIFMTLSLTVALVHLKGHEKLSGGLQTLLLWSTVLLILFASVSLLFAGMGLAGWLQTILAPDGESFRGFATGRMSPVTSVTFIVALIGASLVVLTDALGPRATMAGEISVALGALVSVIGLTLLVLYLFAESLLYGTAFIPPALPTSLGFVALGAGIMLTAAPGSQWLSTLLEHSPHMRLVRTLLVLILVTVLLQALVQEYLEHGIFSVSNGSEPQVFGGPASVVSLALSLPFILFAAVLVGRRVARVEVGREGALSLAESTSQALDKSQSRVEQMMEHAPTSIILCDLKGRVLESNPASERIFGITPAEMIGHALTEYLHPDDQVAARAQLVALVSGDIDSYRVERRCVHRTGLVIWSDVTGTLLRDHRGSPEYVLVQIQDITEHKAAAERIEFAFAELDARVEERTAELETVNVKLIEEVAERQAAQSSLLTEKSRVDTIVSTVEVGLFLLDADSHITYANDLARSWFADVGQLDGRLCWEVFGLTDPERDCVGMRAARTGEPATGEAFTRIVGGASRYFRVTATPVMDELGEVKEITEVVVDLTDRKASEERLEEARGLLEVRVASRTKELLEANVTLLNREEEVRAITESTIDAIVQLDAAGTVSFWNHAAEAMFGYSAEEARGRPVESLIIPEEHVDAHRKGFARFRHTGEGAAIGNSVEIEACRKDGSKLPVELSLSATKRGDDWFAIGVIRDISERRVHDERLKETLEAVSLTLDGSVKAMSYIVETRDPYTAGHQARVADIAATIALDLGLPEDEVDHIRTAALVHDIGKIHLPAEILSKPGRLTSIEFDMIKMHAQVGYDILENIAFSYPVASVALQHHERMDGSGYPFGFKGSEIHIASRIVAVADVLEAMASHRPYRPALGIDAAIEEVRAFRGTRFDADVVDSAVRIFGSGVFKIGI